MENDEKNKLPEIDNERDSEKKSRLSILKPRKSRNPFSTLDFSEGNPDTTLSKARRVSFASSNFIKPFTTDAEKNTIWDNTYEEEVNHTDSTKSSCDQTHGTKTSEYLNTTSVHFATSTLCQNDIVTLECNIADTELQSLNVLPDPGVSLISFSRKLRSKSVEQQNKTATLDCALIGKTTEEDLVDKGISSGISTFNKTTNTLESMEFTACIDKENVNPLINDLSLVLPRRSCSVVTNTTKYLTQDMDFTKLSENNLDFAGLDIAGSNGVTGNVSEEVETETQCKVDSDIFRRRTIYFEETEGNMDFTAVVNDDVRIENKENYSKSKIFQSEIDMEITSVLPVKVLGSERKKSARKEQTIVFNDSGGEMEFTNTFPTQKRTAEIGTSHSDSAGNVHLEDSDEADMEFTNVFPIQKDTVDLTDLKRRMATPQNNERTSNLVGETDNMELTMPRPTKTIIVDQIVETARNTTMYEGDMELTTGFRVNKQQLNLCDMSLTKNICVVNPNQPELKINYNSSDTEYKKAIDAENNSVTKEIFLDPARRINLDKTDIKTSNSSLHLKPLVENHTGTFDIGDNQFFEPKNRPLSTANVQQCSLNHGRAENDDSSVNKCSSDIKRHLSVAINDDSIKKRRIQQPVSQEKVNTETSTTDVVTDGKGTVPNNSNKIALSNNNILYSEPLKVTQKKSKLAPIPDLSTNLNMEGTLNLDHISTPATSFHMNLSTMSPCAEDTQQLIHATFSKPETLKILNGEKSTEACIFDRGNNKPEGGLAELSQNKEDGRNVSERTPKINNTYVKEKLSILNSEQNTEACIFDRGNNKCEGGLAELSQNKEDARNVSERTPKINNTYVKEKLNILNSEKNTEAFIIDRGINKTSKLEGSCLKNEEDLVELSQKRDISKRTPKEDTDGSLEKMDIDFIEMANNTINMDKSNFLANISPLALLPDEFDNSNLVPPTPKGEANHEEIVKITDDPSDSDLANYTLRSQLVLTNIDKYLLTFEPASPQPSTDLHKLTKEFKENCLIIKDLCKLKVCMVDLEEKHKLDLEDSGSSVNDLTGSSEEELKRSSDLGLITPKSLHERITEIAKSTKKYWELIKTEDDYYCFYTLFGTLPFKVHVHPELGTVYNVQTYSNLEDTARPLCHYQLEMFRHKLRQENLLSVLGTKFEIFSLLDYISISMEEIINFNIEFMSLVQKYGKSHHFRMNPDFSITFEVLNVRFIICWIITVQMSVTSPLSITVKGITVVHKVGVKVQEEQIKTIAENTPKGPSFLRNLIENVDEYAVRIGKRLKR